MRSPKRRFNHIMKRLDHEAQEPVFTKATAKTDHEVRFGNKDDWKFVDEKPLPEDPDNCCVMKKLH